MSTATPATSDSGSSAVAKQRMRSFMQTAGMLPVLVLLALLFQFLSAYGDTGTFDFSVGRFLTQQNLPVVAQLAAINTVLARPRPRAPLAVRPATVAPESHSMPPA